ncbi:uncharacterized protein [Phyllobates terribilis]|uniref:uncharacterized protein n=1 Tax=Phyllobates terribilis TaxID=111132 RepID=UPI003CCADBBF
MTAFLTHHNFAVFFGLLGNVVSFMVYLSPTPTFYKIYKAKATQGFQPLPYAVALFSSMLTLYYGLIKEANGTLLITINSVGIIIESVYLTIFMIYASKEAKWKTAKMLLSFNVGLLGVIILLTSLLTHGAQREAVIGWICAICSVCFFASPLCVIRTVIKTKSVEFMPFWLSFSLTICAVMWFFYGFFIRDFYVALPNVLGLAFGITQMTLYFIYKDSTKKKMMVKETLPTTASEVNKVELEQMKVSMEIKKVADEEVGDPNMKKHLVLDVDLIKAKAEKEEEEAHKVVEVSGLVAGVIPIPVVECAV